jgi:hypothetical protein
MRDGSFFKQMEHEHCSADDAQLPFATPQTKGVAKVKPVAQWRYVIEGRDAARSAGEDDGTFDIPKRNGEPLGVYEARMHETNAKLEAEGNVPIGVAELVAVRLYSGPRASPALSRRHTAPATSDARLRSSSSHGRVRQVQWRAAAVCGQAALLGGGGGAGRGADALAKAGGDGAEDWRVAHRRGGRAGLEVE